MTRAELQRAERNLRVVESAHPHDHERRAAALQEAIAAARNSPATVDAYFDLAGLLDELSTAYETLGRPDEALDAMQQAIEAGYAGTPDPRCRLAEIQLRAGRSDEAHRVFADVKRDTPDDVWLYNNAGLEYHHAGDHARALEWFDPGLELAMATHDPERLVDQLADLRQGSLEALGREPDDLQRLARAFLADPPPRRRFPGHPPDPTAGPLPAHPPHRPAYGSPPTALHHAAPPPVGGPGPPVALAWFPAEEWPAALATWPTLADSLGTVDHRTYCRSLEQHLRQLRAADQGRQRGLLLSVAPIRLADFRAWCEGTNEDPGTGAARASYAAHRLRTRADDVVPWPPERNQRCWCGSGRKYKQCCGGAASAHP